MVKYNTIFSPTIPLRFLGNMVTIPYERKCEALFQSDCSNNAKNFAFQHIYDLRRALSQKIKDTEKCRMNFSIYEQKFSLRFGAANIRDSKPYRKDAINTASPTTRWDTAMSRATTRNSFEIGAQ